MQDAATVPNIYCVVDMHAVTLPRAPAELRQSITDMTCSLLACGLDPKRSIIFQQSAVPAIGELNWVLTCLTPIGWLQRMTQWKTKWAPADGNNTAEHQMSLPSGLLMYPTLMAADILLYRCAWRAPMKPDCPLTGGIAAIAARHACRSATTSFSISSSRAILSHASITRTRQTFSSRPRRSSARRAA